MTISKPQPLVSIAPAIRQLSGQLLLLPVLALLAWHASGLQAALSAAAGAGIAVAGQAYFTARAFRHAGARSARNIVQDFYRGEAGKFMLTALLFAAVFITWKQVMPGWLFASFILEQLVAWVVPFTFRASQP